MFVYNNSKNCRHIIDSILTFPFCVYFAVPIIQVVLVCTIEFTCNSNKLVW